MHVETARGTGPGGQHRNTRDTAVRAWHEDHPDIVVVRTSGRSQTINVDDALAELAERIAALHPADKADIYDKLKLTLTYEPEEREVKAIIKPGLDMRKGFVSEGDCTQKPTPAQYGVSAGHGRFTMSAADRVIRWSTALAVVGVATVAKGPKFVLSIRHGKSTLKITADNFDEAEPLIRELFTRRRNETRVHHDDEAATPD